MIVLEGKTIASKKIDDLKIRIDRLSQVVSLGLIQIGENPSSMQYVNIKQKRAEEIGIKTEILRLETYSPEILSQTVAKAITQFTGVMIQLPIPEVTNLQGSLDLVPKELDVDGLCSANLNSIREAKETFRPAVVNAVTDIMSAYKIETDSKSIVVIGNSSHVGNPIYNRLKYLYKHTAKKITVIDEFTKNKIGLIVSADIVISCVGKPHIYDTDILKSKATLIDVGTSPNKKGKIVGDFAISTVGKIAAYTPIPGGIGPLTVANLLENVVLAAEIRE